MHDEPEIPDTHHPPVGLDTPGVPAVPGSTPNPEESEAQAAARLSREADGEQDPWGEPEDRPDHDGNEVYVQQDETRP
jgi:hypothetical protein